MSETVPLEQLLNEKVSAEGEGRELDEEQKQLKARAKILTEKIIQELKKKNKDKQSTINQLQTTVNALENQLSALAPQTAKTSEMHENHEADDPVTESADEIPSADDDAVSVTEVAEEIEVDADSKDKRKRKFF